MEIKLDTRANRRCPFNGKNPCDLRSMRSSMRQSPSHSTLVQIKSRDETSRGSNSAQLSLPLSLSASSLTLSLFITRRDKQKVGGTSERGKRRNRTRWVTGRSTPGAVGCLILGHYAHRRQPGTMLKGSPARYLPRYYRREKETETQRVSERKRDGGRGLGKRNKTEKKGRWEGRRGALG